MINQSQRVLVLTFDAYPHSTRARKAARTLANLGWLVDYVGMSKPGRTGRWTRPGSSTIDNVRVTHVDMRSPETAPTGRAIFKNVLLCYIPALTRMVQKAARQEYDLILVVSAPLIPLGILLRTKNKCRLNFDITERPGAVSAAGSAATIVSHIERPLLRIASLATPNATVVVPPDIAALNKLGFSNVQLLLNAPLSSWRAEFREQPALPLSFVSIGSIFEGRGFEMLIEAASLVPSDVDFSIDIYGTGRPDYIHRLERLTIERKLERRIHWRGPVSTESVSETYLKHHVGLVLYESNDLGNDGLSNKLMECVSSGRPVLAGNLPQNHAFVTSNAVGWTCEMTPASLAVGIRTVVAEARRLPGLSQHCRALGDQSLTWDAAFQDALLNFR